MKYRANGLTDFIFETLLRARNSRRFHQIMREREMARYEEGSVNVALSRMRKNGYAQRSVSGWALTEAGQARARQSGLYSYFLSPFEKNTSPNTIVAFDISEKDRGMRAWLRNQLKIFGYVMLQKSLWQGPGPLPRAFGDRLVNLGIKKNVRVFAITNIKR